MIYRGTNGHVLGIHEKNGTEIWRTKLTTNRLFNAASREDVSVIQVGEVVIASCNGHVWGLNVADGRVLWHNNLPGLGNRFVTMCAANVAIQVVHKHTVSQEAAPHQSD